MLRKIVTFFSLFFIMLCFACKTDITATGPEKCTVTYSTDFGKTPSKIKVEKGTVLNAEQLPSLVDDSGAHLFEGWYDSDGENAEPEKYKVTNDVTLFAKWKLQSYVVYFESNGGSQVDAQIIEHGKLVVIPFPPTKTGWSFAGWFTDEKLNNKFDFTTKVTGKMTLYAKWTIDTYLVEFNSNDGSEVESQNVAYNDYVMVPTPPTKTGWSFAGWFTDKELNNKFDFTTKVTGKMTLYAKWTIDTYLVEFNSNDGSEVESQNVAYNDYVMVPTPPIKTGWTFAGWFTDEELNNKFEFTTKVTGKLTLFAKWMIDTYLVEFNSNGGSEVESQNVAYNDYVMVPTPPTKTGWTFAGWFTDEELNNKFEFTKKVTGKLTLYAKWTIDTYLVEFNSNDGTNIDAQEIIYGQFVVEPSDPEKLGWTFGGWYTNEKCTDRFDFSTIVADKLTLYAKWEDNTSPEEVTGITAISSYNSESKLYEVELTWTDPVDSEDSGSPFDHVFIGCSKKDSSDSVNINQEVSKSVEQVILQNEEFFDHFTIYTVDEVGNISEGESIDLYKGTLNSCMSVSAEKLIEKMIPDCDIHVFGEMTDEIMSSVGSMVSRSEYKWYFDFQDTQGLSCIKKNLFMIGEGRLSKGLKSIKIPEGVTSIEEFAFYGCEGLTDIIIPESVTSIGQYAFADCSGLINIAIPKGVTSIEKNTFAGCNKLTDITIPEGVTSIGESAFSRCTGLTDIIIPESVTSIGQSAFAVCSGLINIAIPKGVTSIGRGAFASSGLISIKIPDGVTSIGDTTFYRCSELTDIIIPKSVTIIGSYAFYGCSGLTSIVIPEGVTRIEEYTFYGCSNLTDITIPEGVTSIGKSAFYECGLTDITIPKTITDIEAEAFYKCLRLTDITIPESVTSIGRGAFAYCIRLSSVTIPEGITKISGGAFSLCISLKSIVIPKSVKSIGRNAFAECSRLENVTFKTSKDSKITLETGAFTYNNLLTINFEECSFVVWLDNQKVHITNNDLKNNAKKICDKLKEGNLVCKGSEVK